MNSTQQPSPCCTSKLIPSLQTSSLLRVGAAELDPDPLRYRYGGGQADGHSADRLKIRDQRVTTVYLQ